MVASNIISMAPISFKFKNKAGAEIQKYVEMQNFCNAHGSHCRPNQWFEVGVDFCLKEDKDPYVYIFNTFVRAFNNGLKSNTKTEEIPNMPKYVDIRSFIFTFGKNREVTQLNLRYRYFKLIIGAKIDPLSYFSLYGGPLKTLHDIPLFDYLEASKTVTNIEQKKIVTLQSLDNNFYNVKLNFYSSRG